MMICAVNFFFQQIKTLQQIGSGSKLLPPALAVSFIGVKHQNQWRKLEHILKQTFEFIDNVDSWGHRVKGLQSLRVIPRAPGPSWISTLPAKLKP